MSSKIVSIVLVTTCVLLSTPRDAAAWGPDGHRIVCRIAFQLLDTATQKGIVKLTATYHRPNNGSGFASFMDGCVFPDEARDNARNNVKGWDKFDPFEHWHFLNVPRTTHLVDESHCGMDCVLTGISHHRDLLKATDLADRTEALFFLGHWMGDIHQPLHISYSNDLGGNNIKPIGGGFYTSGSMHSVWDSGIIGKAEGGNGWKLLADRLAREITPAQNDSWIAAQPRVWAQESYNLTTIPKAEYCRWRSVSGQQTCSQITQARTLTQPYQTEFEDDVLMRLQQAGARLADLLRRFLVLPPP